MPPLAATPPPSPVCRPVPAPGTARDERGGGRGHRDEHQSSHGVAPGEQTVDRISSNLLGSIALRCHVAKYAAKPSLPSQVATEPIQQPLPRVGRRGGVVAGAGVVEERVVRG